MPLPGIQPRVARSLLPPRLLSLDILRGGTVALMILVNDPGDPHCAYPALTHAPWNGYTLADLIFPNFLFLSGASLVFSLQTRITRARTEGSSLRPIAAQLARRALNLLALKLFIAAVPTFRVRRIRIFGVLFRTALLSFSGGLTLFLSLSIPVLLGIVSLLLTGYWLALRLPIRLANGVTLNQPLLDPENNLAAHLDRRIARLFHGHLHAGALYNVTHDPEGLLSSLPALATVLLGAVAALLIRHPALTARRNRDLLLLAAAFALIAGQRWSRTFPANKNLWTSSYTLIAAGWSFLAIAVLYTLYDLPSHRPNRILLGLARPLQIFGANALPAYLLSILGHKVARTIRLQREGHSVSLRTHAYRKLFAPNRSTPLRSLSFAISYAALCFLPNLLLWRRRIFLKV